LLLNHKNIEVIAINDIADTPTMAHLVKYDSIHGVLPYKVTYNQTSLKIEDHSVLFFMKKKLATSTGNNTTLILL